MGQHHDHQPVDVDPHALEESRRLWNCFTKATTFGVVAVVILLAGMAIFLV